MTTLWILQVIETERKMGGYTLQLVATNDWAHCGNNIWPEKADSAIVMVDLTFENDF